MCIANVDEFILLHTHEQPSIGHLPVSGIRTEVPENTLREDVCAKDMIVTIIVL